MNIQGEIKRGERREDAVRGDAGPDSWKEKRKPLGVSRDGEGPDTQGETARQRQREERSRKRKRYVTRLRILLGVLTAAGVLLGGTAGYRAFRGETRNREVSKTEAALETEPASGQGTEDWKLILVNSSHSLPVDFSVELTELKNGQAVDYRIYPELQEMMDDCRAAGLSPVICSSYRSIEKQQSLYENKIERLLAEGYEPEGATERAGIEVTVPGTSEHHTGLALDIVDETNQNLDETQENTEVQQWLMEHSWEYGFVLRYPGGKSGVTGIIYEPWHYRYVGKQAAKEMTERGLCLEEYLEEMEKERGI